jgi:hypothetical protein
LLEERSRRFGIKSLFTGSDKWLDIAEVELSALAAQCLGDQCIGDSDTLNIEVSAWDTQRNRKQKGVDWQFTTADALIKLKRLYPQINI